MGRPNLTFCFAVALTLALAAKCSAAGPNKEKLPNGFVLGTATASYQIEGAWNVKGKGENVWDHLMLTKPNFTQDGRWGDVACDSYNNIKRDIEMLRELGLEAYRFSLSWSRLLPTGYKDKINPDGVRYYKELIDSLLAAKITPMVTLYHWDLPQSLQDIGGWPNPLLADYFEDYADVAFQLFGDKVKTWITFNEPFEVCVPGYADGTKAPALKREGVADYLCAHTLLRAHAKAYRLYKKKYASQKGKIGITYSSNWQEPKNPKSKSDVEAANRSLQFQLGWFAHPVFGKGGNYPEVMIQRIAAASQAQGLPRSRLPVFTKEEIKDLSGSSDFFGLNHYTSTLTEAKSTGWPIPSRHNDAGITSSRDPKWPGSNSPWLKVVPWGFRKLLVWIKEEYNNPNIIVTENGYSDKGQLDDRERISYYRSYLQEMLNAIYDYKVNVTGYMAWSLMDNFEWKEGYTAKFGLYQVNFNDPKRTRTPKKSVKFFQQLAKTRVLPPLQNFGAPVFEEDLLSEICTKDNPCPEMENTLDEFADKDFYSHDDHDDHEDDDDDDVGDHDQGSL